VKSCDRYFFLDQAGFDVPSQMPEMSPLDELLLRGFRASADENGQVVGSKLHSTMQRMDPSFDYRNYGYTTFVKLLQASPVVKVTRPRKVGDVIIELSDTLETEKVSRREKKII
jgi:hypothetical protein